MTQADSPYVPVYGPQFLGYLSDEDARDTVRRQEGRIAGIGTKNRRLILKTAAMSRVRALCNTSTGSALSTVQREELYVGRRKDHTDGPVTSVLMVIRKIRMVEVVDAKTGKESVSGSFQNWGEGESFRRSRFNPDKIPAPIYKSERDMASRKRA